MKSWYLFQKLAMKVKTNFHEQGILCVWMPNKEKKPFPGGYLLKI